MGYRTVREPCASIKISVHIHTHTHTDNSDDSVGQTMNEKSILLDSVGGALFKVK